MTQNRSAALALVLGTVAGLITMVLHPTGADVARNVDRGTPNTLAGIVHLLALIGQGAILAGSLALVARLRARRELAIGGYVSLAMASVAAMLATAASGFIGPRVAAMPAETVQLLMRYTWAVNQTFSTLYIVFSVVALLLWSISTYVGRELGRGLGVYGVVLGTGLLMGLAAGLLRPDIHGFGLVVLTQGMWTVWAARALWADEPPDSPHSSLDQSPTAAR
jgi:hypothetical protein